MSPLANQLPTGTVTFLFTDIEGSTRLMHELGEDAWADALAAHHGILRDTVAAHGGVEISTEGDAFFVAFSNAGAAVSACLEVQRRLAETDWPHDGGLRVRMGLHTGTARLGGDNYTGMTVTQAARIAAAGHGGQILASAATRAVTPQPPPGGAWRALGGHRLKDLGEPVELFQLCHPDLAAEFPPLRTLERWAHNLPIQLSSFVGRDEELAEGAKLLAAARLVSIVGPGGMGKTRLACQLAAEELTAFPDGAWLVELAPVASADRVGDAALQALALRDDAGNPIDAVVAHLQSRRAVVILDNCEHVIDAAASLATTLLRGCPELRVIVTTREALRVQGETVWALRPLAVTDSADLDPASVAASAAGALFLERAAEAKAGFSLDVDNAAAIAAICARVEGLPLAIELAAARVRTIPISQIAARLAAGYELLDKRSRDSTARQSTLRGAISWSHDLLEPVERAMFRRLAVFAGGFTLDAVEEVCIGGEIEVGDVVDLVDGLVEKSLVELREDRYRLLEPIRAFAAEQLTASGEGTWLTDRHAEFYAGLAGKLAGDVQTADAVDRLAADHENLVIALRHLARGGDAARHGRFVITLADLWVVRGYWDLLRRELLAYLGRPDEQRDRAVDGECHRTLGRVAMTVGDPAGAAARYEEALAIARETGDRLAEGRCIGNLGAVASLAGDHVEARHRFEAALGVSREQRDGKAMTIWLGNLGLVASLLGEYDAAARRYKEAVDLARARGDQLAEAADLGRLGELALTLGDLAGARDYFEQALEVSRAFGDRRAEASILNRLASIDQRLGDLDPAAARLEQVSAIASELGDRRLKVDMVVNRAQLALSRGDYPIAQDHFVTASDLARDIGDRTLEVACLGNLGFALLCGGNHDEARPYLESAIVVLRDLGDRRTEATMLGSVGTAALYGDDVETAQRCFDDSLVIAADLGIEDTEILEGCAEVLSRCGEEVEGTRLLAVARRMKAASGTVRLPWEQARFEAALEACRAALGDDRFASVAAEGEALDWLPAVAAARGALMGATRSRP